MSGDSGSYVIQVIDCGPGIAPELTARVFEAFYTTREQGTGLGLPLARKLVEAHGGTIPVASSPGATTFEVVLPRVLGGAVEGRGVGAGAPSRPLRRLSGKGL